MPAKENKTRFVDLPRKSKIEAIKKELDSIEAVHSGILRVEDVVIYAKKHPDSAIHKRLDWDKEKAQTEYLHMQVRAIIREVTLHVVAVEHKTKKVSFVGIRAYQSLKGQRYTEGGGYQRITNILSNPKRREELLAAALNDLERFRERYKQLIEMARVISVIDETERSIFTKSAHKAAR